MPRGAEQLPCLGFESEGYPPGVDLSTFCDAPLEWKIACPVGLGQILVVLSGLRPIVLSSEAQETVCSKRFGHV